MSKNKKHKGLSIAVLALAFVLLVVGILIIFLRSNNVENVVGEHAPSAETMALYEEVVNYDFENNFPASPTEVMYYYNKTFDLLYNRGITDPLMLENVLQCQRKLYSEELLSLNSMDEQMNHLLKELESEERNIILETSQSEEKFDSANSNLCTISVIRTNTKGKEFFYNYYLTKSDVDGRWRIYAFENTNS